MGKAVYCTESNSMPYQSTFTCQQSGWGVQMGLKSWSYTSTPSISLHSVHKENLELFEASAATQLGSVPFWACYLACSLRNKPTRSPSSREDYLLSLGKRTFCKFVHYSRVHYFQSCYNYICWCVKRLDGKIHNICSYSQTQLSIMSLIKSTHLATGFDQT